MARLNQRNTSLKILRQNIQRLSRMVALRRVRRLIVKLIRLKSIFRSHCYFNRPKHYNVKAHYQYNVPAVLQLPPDMYFQAFRMSKNEMKSLAIEILTDNVFKPKGPRPQAPVMYQLALLVYRLAHVVEVAVLARLFRCSRK